ncbi:DUF4112 domain-containing protein [Halorubrum ezzemoulense]|uniref:DUF4112 domain-containing protein n=1 Tax=Halorubrum ezzemoulense TaxID=337243 RepID=A0ABT4Z6L4_HALEZ|nr:DUF4112 domain-containing protein [Halorubrum ezzemoulense]MDB2239427.1 DUF4112 domain-containing protein [Halorubrum ezzemoulense]MDB2293822.1 DUF4112 domain-containing protein [Halorubrum ezzemoulense]
MSNTIENSQSKSTDQSTDPLIQSKIDNLDELATTLDDRWQIPIIKIDAGVDPLIGLIPGIGDVIAMTISSWIVLKGVMLGAPNKILTKMTGVLIVEGLIGHIPVIGDIIDFFWDINVNNVQRLKSNKNQLTGETNWGFLIMGLLTPLVITMGIILFGVLTILSALSLI